MNGKPGRDRLKQGGKGSPVEGSKADAFVAGLAAAREGEPRDACPYRKYDCVKVKRRGGGAVRVPLRSYWFDGWETGALPAEPIPAGEPEVTCETVEAEPMGFVDQYQVLAQDFTREQFELMAKVLANPLRLERRAS